MSKLKLIFCLLILTVFGNLRGQSVSDSMRISLGYPVYSQYLQNGLLINPAYTGTRGALSGFLSYRMQWMGIAQAPVFQTLSFHAPMKNDKVALGIMAQFMQYGVTKSKSIYASYAYHIRLGKGKLSLGLKGGADMTNTDYSKIAITTPGDPVFLDDGKSYILPNFGAGVYYFSDKFFAGVSVPQFLSYKRTGRNTVQPYHRFNEYDYIFSAGGLITLSGVVKFKPSVLLNYSLQDTKKVRQLDINGNFIISDLIWIGGSWRTSEEVFVGIAQIQINQQLMVGFSYDYPAGRMNSYSKGSSEFILRYEFGSRVSAANPRYF